MQKPQRLSRKVVYESPWVNLYLDEVRFPNGFKIDEYHLLHYETEAVAVLIENSWNQLGLVRVYRYPTESVDWEIPAGGIDPGESILEGAQREAFEETGLETSSHELVLSFHPMNGNSDKVFHIVHSQAVTMESVGVDTNEIAEFRWFSKAELREMINQGQIKDGYTLTGLLWYLSGLAKP